jgi:hypothetical protein
MLDVLFLFPSEPDPSGVDSLLSQRLLPQFTDAAGIRSVRLSEGMVMSRGGPSPYSRVLEASFDSVADWMAVVDALNSGPPANGETFAGLAPVVVFFEASEHI